MGGTNFDPNWLAFYALAYSAQTAYNWMTAPSPQSTGLQTAAVQVQPELQVQEKVDSATSKALVTARETHPTKAMKSPVVYVPVQHTQQGTAQPQLVPGPGQILLSPHVLAAAMQYYQQHQAEFTPAQQPVTVLPSLPIGGETDEMGVSSQALLPLTGRDLTVSSPVNATDLTTAAAGDLVQQTGNVVERRGFFRRHPTATGIVGGVPLLGAPFVTNSAGGTTGAGTSAAGGASSTSGGFFWNMYENASSAGGKAYNAASSAASFAWNNTGWTTKLGLGLAAVGLTYYLARRYLRSQASVHVENNNYPTFNNNPTFKQDVHLHFPEGAKVHQRKGEDGVHYTIKAENQRVREQFQEAVRQVIAQKKREAATAA